MAMGRLHGIWLTDMAQCVGYIASPQPCRKAKMKMKNGINFCVFIIINIFAVWLNEKGVNNKIKIIVIMCFDCGADYTPEIIKCMETRSRY